MEYRRVMREEFRISNSYFLPHHRAADWEPDVVRHTITERPEKGLPDHWHPDDVLFVPLIGSDGALVGLLSVDDPQNGKIPDRSKAETLELFAAQAAFAIENARLFEEAQRRLREQEIILRASADMLSSLEMGEVMERIT